MWLCDRARDKARRLDEQGEERVAAVAFSPDSRLLATGGYDKQARLWEVATGRELARLPGHVRSVGAVAFSPDGRTLATADGGPDTSNLGDVTTPQAVKFWDVDTGRLVRNLTGHGSDVSSLAFSPDGRRLVGGLHNGTVLVWETPAAPDRPRGPNLGAAELEARWADLAGDDARRAFAAVHALRAAENGVTYLRSKLRPAAKPGADQVRRWINDLDADRFAVREAAGRALAGLGEDVETELRTALKEKPSAEKRERVEKLLNALSAGAPAHLREVRAVWALQLAGSTAARGVLADLAAGAAGARLTREAAAALK